MNPFAYTKPSSVPIAVSSGARHLSSGGQENGADFFAGGTDMMQLLHERVRNPALIVDVNGLPALESITFGSSKARLGALCRMRDTAEHPQVVEHFTAASEALLASASPQVRNLATIAGNLLQRTRCGYFRDVVMPCNKRVPGSGCPAINGSNRLLAILGTSEHCIATYAGDFANALLVLNAEIVIAGPRGERTIPVAELHHVPGDTPHIETQLSPGELIVAIDVPIPEAGTRSGYLKVRDRTSFAFALASAAVLLNVQPDGIVREVRIAVAGVATKPWRLHHVESRMKGRRFNAELCREAASFAAEGSVAHGENAYKADLLKNTVARGLEQVGGLT